MASRPLIIATLVGASVGVPYLASHSPLGTSAANKAPAASTGSGAQPGTAAVNPPLISLGTGIYPTSASKVDGGQFSSVAQLLRFDVTKEWVYRNWSRKSTGPTDVGLFSVRVPLVMGTQLSSLAGSLTYFFNEQGQVEHISFRGRTGDTTPLVQWLTRYYGFQRVASPTGEQVYQVQSGDGVHSELRTQPEPVLRSNAPQHGIDVELEFARPGSPRVLPPRMPGLQIPKVATSPVTETAPAANLPKL